MSKMIDKVVKMTIQASSIEEAEEKARKEDRVKSVLKSELTTSIFEVVVIQEWYGEHNLGYCKECGDDLCYTSEFIAEKCDACTYPENDVPNRTEERDDLSY